MTPQSFSAFGAYSTPAWASASGIRATPNRQR
jgi:hypothetical protein